MTPQNLGRHFARSDYTTDNFTSIILPESNFLPTNVHNSNNKDCLKEQEKRMILLSECTSKDNSANKNLRNMIKMLKPISNLRTSPSQMQLDNAINYND